MSSAQQPYNPPQGGTGGATAGGAAAAPSPRQRHGAAASGVLFAAVLMLLDGVLGIFEGVMAIAKDDVYTRAGNYVFKFDLTSWGWIHLIIGVVVAVTGLGLLSRALWARVLGVGIAGLSVIANFLFIPYQPWWSLTLVAIGVFVIWSLCAYRPGDEL
ncbi:hypothetical protein ACFYNO_26655 [Kitasatospora sp. NPDC006697]|uniref:DUF7144 family membrane protein n=1 Tax=Kitasatospora sp. NPDC006697 TaxID=3364020 RepID=UPI0036B3EF1A